MEILKMEQKMEQNMKIRNLKKLLIIGLSFFALQAFSLDFVFTNNGYFGKGNAFAIEGFDAVNYFTNDAAAKGNPDFSMQYRGKQWHFKNAQNLAKFKANPEKFAPQYGGHCAWRMAQDGEGVYGDANIWTIVDPTVFPGQSGGVYDSNSHKPKPLAKQNHRPDD
ncbi:MAG: YHS domain-containing protein [Candidatus Thioglobus sp.]|nr:YHS domain-containing protein [Candidatus Thioglobus sp.]